MMMRVRFLRPHFLGEIEYLHSNINKKTISLLFALISFTFYALFFSLRHWVVFKNIFIFHSFYFETCTYLQQEIGLLYDMCVDVCML